MTTAAVHHTGHTSHANRWLIAAVIVLAGALVALGVYTLIDQEAPGAQPVATTPVQTLDQGQMQALVMNKQDALNSYDAAKLASFYAPNARFYDVATGTTLQGARNIATWVTDAQKKMKIAYRTEGGPFVVGDRYVVVPFSLLDPKNMAKPDAPRSQRVEVLEIKDGRIINTVGYQMYN
jgi:hypothetical protein